MNQSLLEQAKINSKIVKKDQELFKYVGKTKKLTPVILLNEKYHDISLRNHIAERDELKSIIKDIFVNLGYETIPQDTKSIRSEIMKVLMIDPKKLYADVSLDQDGFITKGVQIQDKIVEIDEMPENIDNGCYEIINNKVLLNVDKLKQKILLEEE